MKLLSLNLSLCRRRVASRSKRADDDVDDELSKEIDVQTDNEGEASGAEPLERSSSSSHGGHDGPQAATPRDETRSSSAA